MKIIGIDPGIARTGWGVIEPKDDEWQADKFGCITTSPKHSLEERLEQIFEQITLLIKKYKPQQSAIEKLFFNTNAKTAMTVGQARGVTLLALSKQKLPISHYTPLQIKIAITGYGRAEKHQIQIMVKNLLKLKSIPKPDDTADALAVALTHAYTKKNLL